MKQYLKFHTERLGQKFHHLKKYKLFPFVFFLLSSSFFLEAQEAQKKKLQKSKKIIEKHKNTEFTLSISLDGTKEIHDKVRNFKGAYEKVVETIESMKDYSKYQF